MSAYIVGKTHIDAMLTAGLHSPWSGYGPLRWFDAEEPDGDCFAEGEPWGPGSIRWTNEHRQELTRETAGRVGAMLWAENRRSVNHRYAEDEWEEPYEFHPLAGPPDPLVVLKAISCYEYQSCEHLGWLKSEARRFCEVLRGRAIGALPGYEDAPGWEVHDRDVFLKRSTRSV